MTVTFRGRGNIWGSSTHFSWQAQVNIGMIDGAKKKFYFAIQNPPGKREK